MHCEIYTSIDHLIVSVTDYTVWFTCFWWCY